MRLALCLPLILSWPLAAETIQANPTAFHHTFSHTNPVFKRIRPGDVVVTKTLDSEGLDEKGVQRTVPSNPLTGPFFVEGAEPGDVLVVSIRKVRMNRNWGLIAYRMELIALMPEAVEKVFSGEYKKDLILKGRGDLVPWDIDIARQTVRLREPVSSRLRMEFPAQPMIGCIGVAAPGDFAPTSLPSGSYGGNLDYNRIGEGSTVMLPVYHPGALLYLGDAHALMGDGETLGMGVETSMDVEFSVTLKKKAALTGPRVETADDIISVGSQPEFQSSLDRALQLATTDMVRWLTEEYRIEPWAAHQLIGVVGRYDVVTMQGTMALAIPKRYLNAR